MCEAYKVGQLPLRDAGTPDVTEAWLAAYHELKRQDEKMHREYREEIDTLLVFVRLLQSLLYNALAHR
jgi:hypothetical protein